jgi:competence protein ComEC
LTTVATDGGTTTTQTTTAETTTTSSGEQRLTVARVHADAAGADGANLNDEYIVFENTGTGELDLSGWTVADAADHRYTFPEGTTLPAGATVTLHTGSGENTATDYYWGSGSPIWNNGGDTIIVTDADGEAVLTEEYR